MQLVTAVRLSFSLGWVVLFFVEYAAAQVGTEGLGWFVANARAVGRIEEEFAGLIILGFFSFVIDSGFAWLQYRGVQWIFYIG